MSEETWDNGWEAEDSNGWELRERPLIRRVRQIPERWLLRYQKATDDVLEEPSGD